MTFELVETKQRKLGRTDKTAKRNELIVKDRLLGATYRDLTKKYGISNASISYVLSKDEVQEVLADALNHLASFAPIVVKNYRELLNSDKESIQLKATEALASILGFKPSNSPSQINNLYIQQHNMNMITDNMRELINNLSTQSDVIDAEFQEIISD